MFHEHVLASFRLVSTIIWLYIFANHDHVHFDRLCSIRTFSLPSSGKTRRQKVLTSRWIVQSQFVFPGIPRGIDVNPLHSFAIERTTTRRRPAIELLTRYTSLQFFPRRATLSQYPSRCKRKATYP